MIALPIRKIFTASGIILVLLALGAFFSVMTVADQPVEGAAGVNAIADELSGQLGKAGTGATLLVAAGTSREDGEFLEELQRRNFGANIVVARDPAAAKAGLAGSPTLIAATPSASQWLLFDAVREKVLSPKPYRWPNFLKLENLRNISSQIAIIAILAVGMTLVILTGGIDLSVGSLMALSSMCAAWIIVNGPGSLALAAAAAVLLGAAAGAINGSLVAWQRVPAFIATLALMQVCRGLAFKTGAGQSIGPVPESFGWLGKQFTLGVPNVVLLMLVIYVAVHILMTRTVVGRHIYAIGANPHAAQFSGISVPRVRFFVYVFSGALAGLAGVAMLSQLGSGDPKTGQNYELTAIAAAVVGGTSLSGGRGTVFGTFLGALLIGVLGNGLNQLGVLEYDQWIVMGLVILGAVLADLLRRGRSSGP
jgi:ribose transport system permease protein